MLPTQKAFCMEEWKDIPGYEGLYEASNLGRIRTNANKVTSSAGTELHFRSLAAASRYLGRCNGYISNAMKKRHRIRMGG